MSARVPQSVVEKVEAYRDALVYSKSGQYRHIDAARAALLAAIADAIEAERKRCLAITQGWLDGFATTDIKYVSPRRYASDAVRDIAQAIRDGVTP